MSITNTDRKFNQNEIDLALCEGKEIESKDFAIEYGDGFYRVLYKNRCEAIYSHAIEGWRVIAIGKTRKVNNVLRGDPPFAVATPFVRNPAELKGQGFDNAQYTGDPDKDLYYEFLDDAQYSEYRKGNLKVVNPYRFEICMDDYLLEHLRYNHLGLFIGDRTVVGTTRNRKTKRINKIHAKAVRCGVPWFDILALAVGDFEASPIFSKLLEGYDIRNISSDAVCSLHRLDFFGNSLSTMLHYDAIISFNMLATVNDDKYARILMTDRPLYAEGTEIPDKYLGVFHNVYGNGNTGIRHINTFKKRNPMKNDIETYKRMHSEMLVHAMAKFMKHCFPMAMSVSSDNVFASILSTAVLFIPNIGFVDRCVQALNYLERIDGGVDEIREHEILAIRNMERAARHVFQPMVADKGIFGIRKLVDFSEDTVKAWKEYVSDAELNIFTFSEENKILVKRVISVVGKMIADSDIPSKFDFQTLFWNRKAFCETPVLTLRMARGNAQYQFTINLADNIVCETDNGNETRSFQIEDFKKRLDEIVASDDAEELFEI